MPAKWTAELVGKMHLYRVTAKQLAEEAGYHPKYLSSIMNGHIEPKGAEKNLTYALGQLITKRQQIFKYHNNEVRTMVNLGLYLRMYA